jgi:hypothetical protein
MTDDDDVNPTHCGVFYRMTSEESVGPRGGHVVHYQAICAECGRKTPLARSTSPSRGHEDSLATLRLHQCPTPYRMSSESNLLVQLAKFIAAKEPVSLVFAIEHFGGRRPPEEVVRNAWDTCAEGHALGVLLYSFHVIGVYNGESAPRYSSDRSKTFVSFFCSGVSYSLSGSDGDVATAIRHIIDAKMLVAGVVRRCFPS